MPMQYFIHKKIELISWQVDLVASWSRESWFRGRL